MILDLFMLFGSIGKIYVGVMVLVLVCEGKFDFDVKILDFFGDEEWFVWFFNGFGIMVWYFVMYMSGIIDYVFDLEDFVIEVKRCVDLNDYFELFEFVEFVFD